MKKMKVKPASDGPYHVTTIKTTEEEGFPYFTGESAGGYHHVYGRDQGTH